LWDLATGDCLRVLAGQQDGVKSVAIDPGGRYALSGAGKSGFNPEVDRSLCLWDLHTGALLRSITGYFGPVMATAFSPDLRYAYADSWDTTLRKWDLASGENVWWQIAHADVIHGFALHPGGAVGLTASEDGTLREWDLDSGRLLRTSERHHLNVWSVAYIPGGRFAVSSSGRIIYFWDMADLRLVLRVESADECIRSLAVSRDGRTVASAGKDAILEIWELDWDYDFPPPTGWDESARPYLEAFLTVHTPAAGNLPPDRSPSELEIAAAWTRCGRPVWEEADFRELVGSLRGAGFGHVEPEGVRRKLGELAEKRK
jgi:hypothetical protein